MITITKKEEVVLNQVEIFNPEYPDTAAKKDFILDYDCKLTKIDSVNSQFEVEKELKKMNKIIYDKFKYSTTDKLRELMEVI